MEVCPYAIALLPLFLPCWVQHHAGLCSTCSAAVMSMRLRALSIADPVPASARSLSTLGSAAQLAPWPGPDAACAASVRATLPRAPASARNGFSVCVRWSVRTCTCAMHCLCRNATRTNHQELQTLEAERMHVVIACSVLRQEQALIWSGISGPRMRSAWQSSMSVLHTASDGAGTHQLVVPTGLGALCGGGCGCVAANQSRLQQR